MELIRGREILKTANEVAAVLDGNAGLRRITGSSDQAVSNWLRVGRFPPRKFLQFTVALKAKRRRADPALWSMDEPLGAKDAHD